ncbi:MAG: hypothetical protein KDI98_07945, partial [Hyphomicrobiaceae bacterium]|nr:hypothetical protein [Hyphomicrobiaceae bacterium]
FMRPPSQLLLGGQEAREDIIPGLREGAKTRRLRRGLKPMDASPVVFPDILVRARFDKLLCREAALRNKIIFFSVL